MNADPSETATNDCFSFKRLVVCHLECQNVLDLRNVVPKAQDNILECLVLSTTQKFSLLSQRKKRHQKILENFAFSLSFSSFCLIFLYE